MNIKQNNQLRMFKAVWQFLNSIISQFVGFVPLVETITKLGEQIQVIDSLAGKQELNKTGFTRMKDALQKELIEVCQKISLAIVLWAIKNNKNDVENMFSKSQSALNLMKDNEISQYASQISIQAGQISSALTEFMIHDTDITKLTTKLTSYNEYITIARQKRSEVKELTSALDMKIKETSNLIKNELDRLMKIYESDNTTVYGEYRNLRIIEDYGIHHKKPNGNEDNNDSENGNGEMKNE